MGAKNNFYLVQDFRGNFHLQKSESQQRQAK